MTLMQVALHPGLVWYCASRRRGGTGGLERNRFVDAGMTITTVTLLVWGP